MTTAHSPSISLAAKCRILFGWAVLLIIATALLVPWYYMERLVDELNLQKSRHLARIAQARLVPAQADWERQQENLEQWWTANTEAMQLSSTVPKFARVPATAQEIDSIRDAFVREAIRVLKDQDQLPDYRKTEDIGDGHRLYRLALPVRQAGGSGGKAPLVGVVAAALPSLESDAQLWPNRIVIITAGTLAGFLAILVFYLITEKLILAPIQDLKAVVEKVSAGDLDVRSDVKTGDEFEHLSAAINQMLLNLQKSQDELKTINRSLDIRLGELAETNVNLYEANRLKSEFLANVTHELRTPMTSIIGFAELLRDAVQSPDEQTRPRMARYAQNILTSSRSLLELINNLLDLAKSEAGKVELHRTHFAIRDVCERLMDFTRPLVEKKGLQVETVVDDELPMMHSDSGKVQQILYNLLSNAIKFTPEGGAVRLEASRESDREVRIVVVDTGPGIPESERAAVFDKFHQVDASVTREHSGTGLGLPISRELANLLGGSIRLESEEGRGATFTVTLPFECPEKANVPLVRLT